MARPREYLHRLTSAPAAAPARSFALRALAIREFDAGRVSVPSERAKRRHLVELLRTGGHRVFIESGTYLGDTVAYVLPHVDEITSIEIDQQLYDRARARFADVESVTLILGDGLDEVPAVVARLQRPPLVWLDGHASGGVTSHGTHLEPALEILLRMRDAGMPPSTTIVIDDLRVFGRLEGYPALEQLLATVLEAFPDARLTAGLDSLVIST